MRMESETNSLGVFSTTQFLWSYRRTCFKNASSFKNARIWVCISNFLFSSVVLSICNSDYMITPNSDLVLFFPLLFCTFCIILLWWWARFDVLESRSFWFKFELFPLVLFWVVPLQLLALKSLTYFLYFVFMVLLMQLLQLIRGRRSLKCCVRIETNLSLLSSMM